MASDSVPQKKKRKRNQRADGRIQTELTIGRDENGKPIRKFFYGKTRTEAFAKKEAYKKKMDQGISVERYTVNQWIDIYLQNYRQNIREVYLSKDATSYKRIRQQFGERYIDTIKEVELQQFINSLAGMSDSYIKGMISRVKRVFEKAVANHIIASSPAANIDRPKGTSGTHRSLEPFEITAILQTWKENYCGVWAMIMLFAGLRRSEMMALQWDAVDMSNRTISVFRTATDVDGVTRVFESTKSKAGRRTVPMCGHLFDMLTEVSKNRTGDFVCTIDGDGTEPLDACIFRTRWKWYNEMLSESTGRPVHIQMHDLRHTFATMIYQSNIDLKSAQYYMGHASLKMTMDLYTHLTDEQKKISTSGVIGYLDGIK